MAKYLWVWEVKKKITIKMHILEKIIQFVPTTQIRESVGRFYAHSLNIYTNASISWVFNCLYLEYGIIFSSLSFIILSLYYYEQQLNVSLVAINSYYLS